MQPGRSVREIISLNICLKYYYVALILIDSPALPLRENYSISSSINHFIQD